jgi:small subunit ribosomal protein S8
MFTDPIADYLTRVRNSQAAGHKVVDIPSSNMKKSITEILFDKGYILSYKFEDEVNYQGNIKIALKYNSKTPAIKKLIRVSKPVKHKYTNKETMPRVINGLGIAIISTSKGVITDKEARNLNVGGEVICYVY